MADVLTLQEAADYLKVSPDTLVDRAASGEIPSARVGRQWRFMRAQLDEWLSAGGSKVLTEPREVVPDA